MNDPLTPLERRVYHYLLDFLAENTFQPSVREIGKRFRIKSTKTVAEVLQSLAGKGFIEREGARSRGVRIVGWSSMGQVQPVPLYARVNPVEPYLTDDNRERWVAMDRSFVPSSDAFLLRQSGDAMMARGVHDGDWILVAPSTRARDGDLVAARIGPHVLVRVVQRQGAVLSLSATNGDARELFLGPSDDFSVLGVVTAIFRTWHDEPAPMEPGA
ncbi:MAG: repressor LexA [Gemmatimonadaceae bacterium]|nr:repressor LexA [Gemmatimonadaceae bacterium]